MNTENQTPLADPTPATPRVRMSHAAQALWGLALLVIGVGLVGIELLGAIGGAIGGHANDSFSAHFWGGTGLVAGSFGLVLLLAALMAWRTWAAAVVFFGAVGLFMGIGAVSDWSRQRDMDRAQAREAAVFEPWKLVYDSRVADVQKAIDADDPAALATAGQACTAYARTVPVEFQTRVESGTCDMGPLDKSKLLDRAFSANAWRILDGALDLAQKEAEKSGSWGGTDLASAPGTCFADLASRDEDAPWLMPREDRSTTSALREAGTVAAPQGPVPTEMLKVLARHRAAPLRVGEGALQGLFSNALSQRRMDIVEAISTQVKGRFEWCADGGAYAHNLVDAIHPSSQGRAWKEGEAVLFRAIASWPQKAWREVADIYFAQFVYGTELPRAQAQALCISAAARIAALRPGADRASLIEKCRD